MRWYRRCRRLILERIVRWVREVHINILGPSQYSRGEFGEDTEGSELTTCERFVRLGVQGRGC